MGLPSVSNPENNTGQLGFIATSDVEFLHNIENVNKKYFPSFKRNAALVSLQVKYVHLNTFLFIFSDTHYREGVPASPRRSWCGGKLLWVTQAPACHLPALL